MYGANLGSLPTSVATLCDTSQSIFIALVEPVSPSVKAGDCKVMSRRRRVVV